MYAPHFLAHADVDVSQMSAGVALPERHHLDGFSQHSAVAHLDFGCTRPERSEVRSVSERFASFEIQGKCGRFRLPRFQNRTVVLESSRTMRHSIWTIVLQSEHFGVWFHTVAGIADQSSTDLRILGSPRYRQWSDWFRSGDDRQSPAATG